MNSTNATDLKEMQKVLAELLTTKEGRKTLENLIGKDAIQKYTEQSNLSAKRAGQKANVTKKLRDPRQVIQLYNPYVLRIRHLCNLCQSTTYDFFLMTWSPERKAYISKHITHKDLSFANLTREQLSKLCYLVNRKFIGEKQDFKSPTLKTPIFELELEKTEIRNSSAIVSSCKICETVLSFLPKDELIRKLIRQSNRLDETKTYLQNVKKLTEGVI